MVKRVLFKQVENATTRVSSSKKDKVCNNSPAPHVCTSALSLPSPPPWPPGQVHSCPVLGGAVRAGADSGDKVPQ